MSEQEIVGQVVTTDKLIPSLTVNPAGQILDHTGRIVGKLAGTPTVLRVRIVDVYLRSDGKVFKEAKDGQLIGKLRNNEVRGLLGQDFGKYLGQYGSLAAAAFLALRSYQKADVIVHYFEEKVVERGCLDQLFGWLLKAGFFIILAIVVIAFVVGMIMSAISFVIFSSPIWISFLVGAYVPMRFLLARTRSGSESEKESWEALRGEIQPVILETGFVVATAIASLAALLAWGSIWAILGSAAAVALGWFFWTKLADKQAQAYLERFDRNPQTPAIPPRIVTGIEFVAGSPRKAGVFAIGAFVVCAAVSFLGSSLTSHKAPLPQPQTPIQSASSVPPSAPSTTQPEPAGTTTPEVVEPSVNETTQPDPSKVDPNSTIESNQPAPPSPASPAPAGWNWVLVGTRYSIAPVGWSRTDSTENGVVQAKFTKGDPDTNVTFRIHPKGSASPQQFVETEEARYKSSPQFKYELVRIRLGSEAFQGGAIWNFRLAENGGRLNQRLISYFELPDATYEISLSYQADLPGKPYRTYFEPLFADFSKWK